MAKTSAKPKQPSVPTPEGKPQPIELTTLEFDPENPRTVERLGRDASQARIEEFLLGGEIKAQELVPSFIENRYIPYEPLIVRRGKPGGNLVVVEGNRRLAALRSMEASDEQEAKAAFTRHGLSRYCLFSSSRAMSANSSPTSACATFPRRKTGPLRQRVPSFSGICEQVPR